MILIILQSLFVVVRKTKDAKEWCIFFFCQQHQPA